MATSFLRIVPLLAALFLGACQTLPQPEASLDDWLASDRRALLAALDRFTLSGKLGIRQSDRSDVLSVQQWEQQGENYRITVVSPVLGLGGTRLTGNPDTLEIERGGDTPLRSKQPQALLAQELGWSLPIDSLRYWVRGLPAPEAPYESEQNVDGDALVIRQSGWTIQYQRFSQVALPAGSRLLWLPERIRLSREDIRLTLVIAEWTLQT